MAVVNVNPDIDDQFYRYKMPKLIAKVEGKGNGIKTVIVNMPEISKALDRPPTYPCKFFGCELGAQVQFDSKNERYIVNGSHDAPKLQELLFNFIKKFVLCQGCDNPETKLVVQTKKQMILQRCIACGHQADIDMRHKFTTYILKNPPSNSQQEASSAATPNKKVSKKDKKKPSDGPDSPEAGQGDTNGQITPPVADDFDDDDWGDDVTDTAIAQRAQSMSDAVRSMTINDDMEKSQKDRVNMFYEFVKARKSNITATAEKEIVAEADRLDVREKAPLILAELLYDDQILTQIKKFRTLFLRFTHESPKAQKYLLGAFEQLCADHQEALVPRVPHILKTFYDCDIVDEEVFMEWGNKVSKKYVTKDMAAQIREKAKPFLAWLAEAEEESSEEEDDGLEIDFSSSAKAPVVQAVVTEPAAAKGGAIGDDEEFIDDI